MILNEFATLAPQKQVTRIFEQYFGQKFDITGLDPAQTRKMLRRVSGTLAEHRSTSFVHTSETNSAYLKLIMMEQALQLHLASFSDATRAIMEENEVQQAQVVLASQDMVDKVQKMIEEFSEMQYKELPALVDSIRNQVGTAEADAFNNSATSALEGLIANLQNSKAQLEQSKAILTGQAPEGAPGAMPGEPTVPGAMPEPATGEIMPPPVEEPPGAGAGEADLGRAKR
jgi:hypothetical protein